MLYDQWNCRAIDAIVENMCPPVKALEVGGQGTSKVSIRGVLGEAGALWVVLPKRTGCEGSVTARSRLLAFSFSILNYSSW